MMVYEWAWLNIGWVVLKRGVGGALSDKIDDINAYN